MRKPVVAAASLVTLALALSPTAAQNDDFTKLKSTAIDKGSAWVKKAQAADGSWDYDNGPFSIQIGGAPIHMKQGTTALCALRPPEVGRRLPTTRSIKKALRLHPLLPDRARLLGGLRPPRARGSRQLGAAARGRGRRGARRRPDARAGGGQGPARRRRSSPRRKDLELAGAASSSSTNTQQPERRGATPPVGGTPQDASRTRSTRSSGSTPPSAWACPCPSRSTRRRRNTSSSTRRRKAPRSRPSPSLAPTSRIRSSRRSRRRCARSSSRSTDFKGKKAGETNADGHTEEDERRTTEEDAARKILKTRVASAEDARAWLGLRLPADRQARRRRRHPGRRRQRPPRRASAAAPADRPGRRSRRAA